MKYQPSSSHAGLLLLGAALPFLVAMSAQGKVAWWPPAVEQVLGKAGSNRPELEKALYDTPSDQRPGMLFLIANMPDQDLRTLKADFLQDNVRLAYQARRQVAWGPKIPDAIFFNDVLAYANVDEERDAWRQELYDLCMPLIKDCKTPREAAQLLNVKVFETLKVRYSTRREKAHQSPKETIAQGRASCTGLSILLADACRSVAIPARIVGTPRWIDQSGNHTWVEIWDQGWHFTGACEQDKEGLDRGWFVDKAGQAKKDVPEHAIYAASFRKTAVPFPLAWAPSNKDVSAENVTDRYARAQTPKDEALKKAALGKEQSLLIEQAARAFFAATAEQQAKWQFEAKLDSLLVDHEAPMRALVWKAFQTAQIHAGMRKDFEDNQVRFKDHLSAYKVRDVGKRPEKGWPLFIALHGGGNAPTKVNDDQWKRMQSYYKDQPSVEGYKYLALRAPNDTWNGFYDEYVPPLVMNLIRQFLLFGDVDPDKAFLMGYSHGGYGAFYLGPKIPDRFAAVHASAAAPTDGTISPLSLRNTRFTFMVGEKDTAYGRRERCEKFNQEIRRLQREEGGGYPVDFELKQGYGHGGLPDRDKIKEMIGFTRSVTPRHVTWELTDNVVTNHFWLGVAQPERGQRLDAHIQGNEVIIATRHAKQFDLALDGRMIALDKPLRITLDGMTQVVTVRPKLLTLCQSMLRSGDAELAWTCAIPLGAASAEPTPQAGGALVPAHQAELIFPLHAQHNHAPGIVECPNGDLLVSWYRGSGERQADDVAVYGARLRKQTGRWSEPFLLADTPGFPDCNTALFIDAEKRLWLFWPVILDNTWESCLTNYRRATSYEGDAAPKWDWQGVLYLKPLDFEAVMLKGLEDRLRAFPEAPLRSAADPARLKARIGNKLSSRLGWQPRCKPTVLPSGRILLPLYSDTYSVSLMAISDDQGKTWRASRPLAGFGNIQPAVLRRQDGTLVAYMRENGPLRKIRVSESNDNGVTWGPVGATTLPNPGSGLDAVALENGYWMLVYNDTTRGRASLAVSLSEDEGRTWKWIRHLERHANGSYHYPAAIVDRAGTIHVVYSYFVEGGKSMKHAAFNESWIRQGDPKE